MPSSRLISSVNLIEPFLHRLDRLLADDSEGVHISIYQGAGHTHEDAIQSRLSFKSCIHDLKENPLIRDRSHSEIEGLFEAADELVDDTDFWERNRGGLAFFIHAQKMETVKVPCQLPPRSVVASSYHLKPLMALATNPDAYYLLSLNQDKIRLYRGCRLGIHETHVPGLPRNYDRFVREAGLETDTDASLEHLSAYFEHIDQILLNHLANHDWPLLLSGPDYFEPIYRDVSSYPHLSKSYLPSASEIVDLNELHQEATRTLHGEFIESQKRTLLRFRDAKDSSQTESDLDRILPAAFRGEIETLLVPHDHQEWGVFDSNQLLCHRSSELDLLSSDLYEVAARETLAKGGNVYFLQAAQLPHGSEAVALLR